MINTVNIKKEQLNKGFLTLGSGKEVVLIMGSCRVLNFVNYLNEWNIANGDKFTIHTLDVFNWNWDINDDRVDFEEVLLNLETNDVMLSMLKSVDIFIHEFYSNYGMFNVRKESEKNIYQYGMNPKIDVCLPNFNDYFILVTDIITFDTEIRKRVIQDWNVVQKISEQTLKEVYNISQRNLSKFYNVCSMSDIPEMEDFFKNNFIKERLWWSYNHTTKAFTLALFEMVNDKFMHLDLSKGFNRNHVDVFANNYTKLTEYDVELYGYKWSNEEIIPLQQVLFH